MTRPVVAKSKRSEAERAAEHFIYHVYGCDPNQILRAVRTKYQSVDIWACDVAGRTRQGFCYYAQVTCGQVEAVRTRRRKLEKIHWNEYDTVMVLQMVAQPDPANARRKLFYYRIHSYNHTDRTWEVYPDAYKIPREWFKKLRVEDLGAED